MHGRTRCQFYNGRADWVASGWRLDQVIGALAPGVHTASVIISDTDGQSSQLAGLAFLVVSRREGDVEIAQDAASGSGTLQQQATLQVAGWAIDRVDGSPVGGNVQILLDGNAIGSATLAGPRPDIATLLGDSKYGNAGWTLTYEMGAAPPGQHRIGAVASNAAGRAVSIGERTIAVTANPQAPFGRVDLAGNAATGAGTAGGTTGTR